MRFPVFLALACLLVISVYGTDNAEAATRVDENPMTDQERLRLLDEARRKRIITEKERKREELFSRSSIKKQPEKVSGHDARGETMHVSVGIHSEQHQPQLYKSPAQQNFEKLTEAILELKYDEADKYYAASEVGTPAYQPRNNGFDFTVCLTDLNVDLSKFTNSTLKGIKHLFKKIEFRPILYLRTSNGAPYHLKLTEVMRFYEKMNSGKAYCERYIGDANTMLVPDAQQLLVDYVLGETLVASKVMQLVDGGYELKRSDYCNSLLLLCMDKNLLPIKPHRQCGTAVIRSFGLSRPMRMKKIDLWNDYYQRQYVKGA